MNGDDYDSDYLHGWWIKSFTTNTTNVNPVADEEQVRRIVRQELADLMPIDVPDAPPEDF